MLLDLFTKPAEIFIKEGIDAFRRSAEAKNLTLAVRDRIRREVRLNNMLLTEVLSEVGDGWKYEEDIRIRMLCKLSTSAFHEVESGSLPLSIFFDSRLHKKTWPQWNNREKYMEYCNHLEHLHELVERAYQRAMVAKSFAELGVLQGDSSYLRFLFAALEKEIRETSDHPA